MTLYRPRRTLRKKLFVSFGGGRGGARFIVFPRRIPPKLIAAIAAFVIVVAGAWYLLAISDLFLLRTVKVSGLEHIPEAQVQDAAHMFLAKKRFLVLPQNFLFADIKALSQMLSKDFPRIASARITRTFRPFALLISIEERTLFAFWCQGKNSNSVPGNLFTYSIGQCFILDKSGIVFDGAPPSQGALVLTLVEFRDQTPHLGDLLVDAGVLGKLEQLRQDVKREANVNMVRMVLVNTRELRGETAEGWVMLFDPSGDLDQQIQALRETLVLKLTPDKRKGLSYIDVRTPGRVFYK